LTKGGKEQENSRIKLKTYGGKGGRGSLEEKSLKFKNKQRKVDLD